jgi:hypothetical protein
MWLVFGLIISFIMGFISAMYFARYVISRAKRDDENQYIHF